MKAKAKRKSTKGAKRTKSLPVRGRKGAGVTGGSNMRKKMDDTIAGQQQKIG